MCLCLDLTLGQSTLPLIVDPIFIILNEGFEIVINERFDISIDRIRNLRDPPFPLNCGFGNQLL